MLISDIFLLSETDFRPLDRCRQSLLASHFFPPSPRATSSMDTISRENNSMLPVGAIIVGVIALLLGGYAAITVSKVNRALADQDAKLAKLDQIETTSNAAANAAEKAAKEYQGLRTSTQDAFNLVSDELKRLSGSLVEI